MDLYKRRLSKGLYRSVGRSFKRSFGRSLVSELGQSQTKGRDVCLLGPDLVRLNRESFSICLWSFFGTVWVLDGRE